MLDDNPLKLSPYQQNAMAELAIACGSIAYRWRTFGEQPTPEQLDKILETIDKYDLINWGELYDKFHRSGSNSI